MYVCDVLAYMLTRIGCSSETWKASLLQMPGKEVAKDRKLLDSSELKVQLNVLEYYFLSPSKS